MSRSAEDGKAANLIPEMFHLVRRQKDFHPKGSHSDHPGQSLAGGNNLAFVQGADDLLAAGRGRARAVVDVLRETW